MLRSTILLLILEIICVRYQTIADKLSQHSQQEYNLKLHPGKSHTISEIF
jgi:hypothetical protein